MRLVLAALAVCITVNAATAQQPYGREKVVEVDTVTSAEVLRATARKWFVDTYKDANEVIQMDDATTNTIVGKGWTEFGSHAGIHYTIEVQCKKGRVRIRVYDVMHKGRGSINTGAGYAPAISWGDLFDEERCFVPVRVGFQSEHGAEKQMLKFCAVNRPEIASRLDALVISIEGALKAPKAASSDW
jgi:hypothetical protein